MWNRPPKAQLMQKRHLRKLRSEKRETMAESTAGKGRMRGDGRLLSGGRIKFAATNEKKD